ncbi:M15 family metallopeptidase [Mycobacterium canetti]|uniref:M15 family metallopeptidase n=1 Tax=Mycobacterium canetti TaxID=78331 RepID=UPI001E511E8A|nr:M15 family metallopeptidase [Mycobacterium canetti]
MARRVVYGNAFSENGWPMVDQASCDWVRIPGAQHVSLQIQQGQPLTILRAFAADFHAYVELLRDADSACWTPTNSVPTSNHLSGTAVDLNWNSHPFKVLNAGFNAAQIATIRELLEFYEGTIFWGNDWTSPKDAMHWQMGYGTFGNPRTGDFIARKIRLDGFSAFRRGTASVDAVRVLSDAMGARLSLDRYRQLLPAVAAALRACQCTTTDRIAMWCAQIGHESGGLYYTEEIASGAAYEGRSDLGNTQPGDGMRFKGRSWIQITGRSNYTRLSQWAYDNKYVGSPTVFVDNPERLAADEYAGLGAAWYWVVARPDINAHADRRDLETVTRRINGGLNGLPDRRSRYDRALRMGDQLLVLIGGDDGVSPELERMIREIHGALFNHIASQSIYATPGEGARWQLHELVKNGDGMLHALHVEAAARLGDFAELERVARTAADLGAVTDPNVVARARNLLAEIEAAKPQLMQAFLGQKGTRR